MTNAPTESCVSTVIITSDQCACAGVTCVTPTGRASGGSCAGMVTRVVEMLPSATGTPSPPTLAANPARHSSILMISIWMRLPGTR